MEGLRQYVLSVTAVALACGIAVSLVRTSGAKALIQMLCGLLLAITVVRPVAHLELVLPDWSIDSFQARSEENAAAGEKTAQAAMADIIKSETEAYILDKASALNVQLTVEVTLSRGEVPIPERAVLRGNVPPDAREQLSTILQKDLGITKENQLWTG